MAKSKQPKLVATRDFKDAGSERRFEMGKPVDVDAGTLANYQAAGLVAAPDAPAEKPAA